MDMRVSKATAVVVQQVPASSVSWFMDWQQGITDAMEAFAGHLGTDVYPPPGGQGGEWVVVVSFEDEVSLQAWLDSPVRNSWVKKLHDHIGAFDLKVVPGGFGPWFAGCVHGQGGTPPPSWKMALVVLLGLYPTVMLLTLFPGPFINPLGMAVAMLIGNALSVTILQWGVMPMLLNLSASWLAADDAKHRAYTVGGVAVILGVLIGLALTFRQVTG